MKIWNSQLLEFSVIDIFPFVFGLCLYFFVFSSNDFFLILWNRILYCFSFYEGICYFAIASSFFELQIFVGFRISCFD